MTFYDQDVHMVAGDTQPLQVTNVDHAGAPLPLTNMTIRYAVAADKKGATIICSKDNDPAGAGGITVTDEAGGVFEIAFNASDTEDLEGEYYHEAEVEDDSGNINTVLKGKLYIEPAIIKPAPS